MQLNATSDTESTEPTPDSESSERDSKTIPAGQRVEFAIPQGWNPPESPDPTKDIDLVCSFRVKDGKLCLTKLGDFSMPGGDDYKTETKPDYSSMVPTQDAGPMGGQTGGGMGMSSMGGY